eukprot:gene2158-2578_t
MSTKTAYRGFVRKYQLLRGNMRQRELALRVLERRLDQREIGVLDLQEKHRSEISALKKALMSFSSLGEEVHIGADPLLVGGQRKGTKRGAVTLAAKLAETTAKAASAVKRAEEAEEVSRQKQNEAEDLKVEVEMLQKKCTDLSLAFTSDDSLGPRGSRGKIRSQLAARLIALSDEVRVNKLAALQQRREILVLRQEKKHLKSLLAAVEADVEGLEESKVQAETKRLLQDVDQEEEGDGALEGDLDQETLQGLNLIDGELNKIKPLPPQLRLQNAGELDEQIRAVGGARRPSLEPTAEELVEKLEAAQRSAADQHKENLYLKQQCDRMQGRVTELERELRQREVLLNDQRDGYYDDRGDHAHDLRSIRGEQVDYVGAGGREIEPELTHSFLYGASFMRPKAQLQEAATATMSSMRALLEEKNRVIDRYRVKLEELQSQQTAPSVADRRAGDLLRQLEGEEERGGGVFRTGQGNQAYTDDQVVRKLSEQVDRADELLREKDRIIGQLEQKYASEVNQRERAEARCGSAIEEMEAMKADLITLAEQLQATEENAPPPPPPEGLDGKSESSTLVRQLQAALKAKESKIVGYRQILIRLKEEFIKSEQDHAVAVAAEKSRSSGRAKEQPLAGVEELSDLRSQVEALRAGLRQAKEDLESARKGREKLAAARQAAIEDAQKLEQQLATVESQAATSQKALEKCRRELEERRRKEVNL